MAGQTETNSSQPDSSPPLKQTAGKLETQQPARLVSRISIPDKSSPTAVPPHKAGGVFRCTSHQQTGSQAGTR